MWRTLTALAVVAMILVLWKWRRRTCARLREYTVAFAMPRVSGTPGHDFALLEIAAVLPCEYRIDTFERDGRRYKNVVASLYPHVQTDRRRIVFVAHTDSAVGDAAIDSATGCAVLVTLAREFMRRRPNVTLQFAFVDGEEAASPAHTQTLAGARKVAQDTIDSGDSAVAIVLSLVGARGSTYGYAPGTNTDIWSQLCRADATAGTGLLSDRTVARTIDDHVAFVEAGIPCALVSAMPFPQQWHTVGDTADTVDYEQLARMCRMLTQFVLCKN